MKTQLNLNQRLIKAVMIVFTLLGGMLLLSQKTMAQAKPIKNIVIVHGAFADGSGWRGVFDILSKKGYHITVVQNPLTGLKNEVEAIKRILDKQDGPTVLVEHSSGGVVITEAGVQV